MSAKVHEIYPPEPDLDVAIAFLKLINPDGRQAFRGHSDEGSTTETPKAVFEPGMWDEKRALIKDWSSRRLNVWVLPNEPLPGTDGMKDEDVGFIRAFFSDTDHKGLQQRALDALDDPMRASHAACVNDSGAGIHVYWILDAPIAVTPEVQANAERIGRGVMLHMDGDHVWNINRPMRVPGTVNYLSKTKRDAGRLIVPTTTLAAGTARVTMEGMLRDFPAPPEAAKTKVSDEAYQKALAELDLSGAPPDAGLIAKIGGLWTAGVVNGDATGSGHLWRLALKCRDEGLSGAEFSRLAKVWSFIGPRQTEARSMARAWARSSKGAQAAGVFEDIPPGDMGPAPVPKGDFGPIASKKALPRRAWLYGGRLIRGYLSGTVAAGGTGKSTLTMVEAVAMTSGTDLFSVGKEKMPRAPLRVLIWNGEDPQVELDLRYHAILKEHGIDDTQIGGRLFVISGRDFPIGIGGPREKEDAAWLVGKVKEKAIDVIMIDPFVSSHRVPENDNMAIDKVAKFWTMLAEKCGCAVDLVHHVRKPGNGMAVDLTVDDARGASALVNASRNARVLVPLSKEGAAAIGVPPDQRRSYICIHHDATKANMVPGGTGVDYYKFKTVQLDNGDPYPADGGLPIDGDRVGVLVRWFPSVVDIAGDPAKVNAALDKISKGDYRRDPSVRSGDGWVGLPIADVLGLDPKDGKKLIVKIVDRWLAEGWLIVDRKEDKHREKKDFIIVGNRPAIPDEKSAVPDDF